MRKVFMLLGACLLLTTGAVAQNISVTDALGQMPGTFIYNNLIGGGVYVFNAKFANSQGPISARNIGTFQANGFGAITMNNGIILTTGDINVAPGPNNMGGHSMQLNPYYSDPELNSISTNEVTSCATLDFDFVALTTSVSFNYCFGSEEYPEYVCSSFNDVFAFFLTGPDPETGIETTRNIAIIPGSDTVPGYPHGIPVTINAVNPGVAGTSGGGGQGCFYDYSHLYYDNTMQDGDTAYPQGVQYDGFTRKMAASAQILPCVVYHMHISVCNVQDNAFDSGVMIEGGSFTAPTAAIGLSRVTVDTVKGSCPTTIPLTLANTSFDEGLVNFGFGGTAEAGVHYQIVDENGNDLTANSMTIDNTVHTIRINGLQGADLSQARTIEVYLATALCPEFPQLVTYDTMRFVLVHGGDVKVKDSTINCTHACFEIGTELVYGDGDVSYRWEPTTGIDDPFSLTSTAMIFESRDYHLIATGGSGCNSDTALVRVVINNSDPDIPVSIEEAEGENVHVFPNPATDVIGIEATGLRKVEIFSVEGRKVYEAEYESTDGIVEISTEGLANGVYGIRVNTNNGVSGAKIVVNK